MRWFQFFLRSVRPVELERLARLACEASLPAVRNSCSDLLIAMNLSEARGYAYARASRHVRREVGRLANADRLLTAEHRNRIHLMATEQVARRVVREQQLQKASIRTERSIQLKQAA